jgi:branched-subunit amino acid aminotransferase/4-amino-4-deoxychorismate lyase
MSTRLFSFSGEALGAIEWCDPVAGETLVADSWRVESGQAVALERHRDRFFASAAHHGLESAKLSAFWDAVIAAIPLEGSWFPRVEVVATPGGPTLRYRERVAPAWNAEVIVARASHDPRRHPHTKGPDLEALLALRASVAPLGAGEAIITTDHDCLVEGAYSSLMVWLPGSDSPLVVPPSTPHLRGVTESVITDLAGELGVAIHQRDLSVRELEGSELWILSALHGIRVATAFIDGPPLGSVPGRRDTWQSAWWSQAKALTAPRTA